MATNLLSINTKSSALFIFCVAIGLLVWAFGSYILYIYAAPEPRICFPPVTGCLGISSTGMTQLSGVFFRAVILPLAPLIGFSFFLGIVFLKKTQSNIPVIIKTLLFFAGVVVAPISLIITESIINGTFTLPFPRTHIFCAKIAFFTPVFYMTLFSCYLLTLNRKKLTISMFVVSMIAIVCWLLMPLGALLFIKKVNSMMAWNILISVSIWMFLMGLQILKTEQAVR